MNTLKFNKHIFGRFLENYRIGLINIFCVCASYRKIVTTEKGENVICIWQLGDEEYGNDYLT